jgi:diketogulonate reductase-like aldo/keto reductase
MTTRREFLGTMAALAGGAAPASTSVADVLRAPGGTDAPPADGQPSMLTRVIPRSSVPLPVVGLGTWQTFDPPVRTAEVMRQLEETLRALLDSGGRVVDSSPMYGDAEGVVGELAERAGLLDRLFLATKVWTSGREQGIRQMERSAALMRRPVLDLMQVHNLVDWRTQLDTLVAWRREGRVRHIGVTHYTTRAFAELERVVVREPIDVVQLPYSLAQREAEQRLLAAARDAGVAVLVNVPFGGGDLLRTVVRRPLPDHVRDWAPSWPQALLKYVLADPAVTCVIPGTSNSRHMRDNAAAGSGRLPDARERRALVTAALG